MDTELFPEAARARLRPTSLTLSLSAVREGRTRERFGEDGFQKMVDRVARLERGMVGINDLDQYTPPR